MSANNSAAPRIVAGVDGSPSSLAALRWAVDHARRTGGTVDAVLVWQIPASYTGFGTAPMVPPDWHYLEEQASRLLDKAVGEVATAADEPLVRKRTVHGVPAEVLLQQSVGADLLVLGSRGHSGIAEALLGSVGQHCVHHARCPVLIMRDGSQVVSAA